MVQTLFGIKKNMTSTYDARGRRVGATVVEMKPSVITQVKSAKGKVNKCKVLKHFALSTDHYYYE